MKPAIRAPKRSEWQPWVTAFLRHFDAMDRALVAAGFPPTSPWWRAQIERFLRRGCRRWVIRAGRRGGKSSTLCRLTVAWAKWGPWSVPPGDVAVVAFVSVDRDEASARLRTISAVLTALGIPFDERSDEIELRERRLVFRVTTCSIKGAVGFTSVLVVADEMARWESRDAAANPAASVMGSLRPTGATQPFWFEICVSSPWGSDDYHAELFDAGDTDHQAVSFAATWTANPTITEQQTHELEPDPKVHAREYAAQPGVTVSAALDPSDVAACFDRQPSGQPFRGFLAIDASSLRGDAFAWVGGKETDADELVVLECDGFEGQQLREVSMTEVVVRITERAGAWGTHRIFGDQREEAALRSMFSERGFHLETFAWSESSKDAAFMALRRLMRARRVILPNHAGLRRELTSVKAHLLPSGRTKYATNGLDYLSALVTLIHALCAGELLTNMSDSLTDELLIAMGVPVAPPNKLAREANDEFLEPCEFHDPVTYESRWDIPGRGFG